MRRLPFILGVVLLAACDRDAGTAPAARPPYEAPTSSSAPTEVPLARPPAATQDASAVQPTAPETALGLRPSYAACIEKADAVVPATQACIEAEATYQQARLERALDAAKRANPGEAAALQYRQVAWQADTDRKCAWDAETEGQQQRLEANMCSLDAVSRRADELSR